MEAKLFWELLTVPIASSVAYVSLHILFSRFIIKKGTIQVTLVTYFIGLLFFIFFQSSKNIDLKLPSTEIIGLFMSNFFLYSGSAFLYFCFVNIGETSVRIRILRELSSNSSAISRADLAGKYSVDHVIDGRLERMISSGEIFIEDGRYYFSGKAKMLLLAKACQRIKKLLLGQKSFDVQVVQKNTQLK